MASLSSSTSLLTSWPHIHRAKKYYDGLVDMWKHGKSRGISTGFPNLDPYWTVLKTNLVTVTGSPGAGKSEFVDQICFSLMSREGWKVAYYSPENKPYHYHLYKLVEKHMGDALRWDRDGETTLAPRESVDAAVEFFDAHTYWVDGVNTLDGILNAFRVLSLEGNVDACVIDPWNRLEVQRPHNVSESEWVGKCLQQIQDFSRCHNVVAFVVAHPKKMERDASGKYPVVRPWDISGSANWFNVSDVVLSIYREFGETDVAVHVSKVRSKLVGTPGVAEFGYSIKSGRYHPRGSVDEVPF